MLQGKTLNVLPSYSPEAEEALSKAVKLDPKLVEAWNQLGENYWKKGKVPLAKNCFTGALNHVRNDYEMKISLEKTFVIDLFLNFILSFSGNAGRSVNPLQ